MRGATIDVALLRGGTSKGVFVEEADLPPPGPERDSVILRLLGSPDPLQLDGLGGGQSSTSKLMALSAGAPHDCDLAYLFAQVAVDAPVVDYAGNCGNLTAAVALLAAERAWVASPGPARVMLYNKNTRRRIAAEVVAGEAGEAAEIRLRFLEPAGAVTGRLLPTGRVIEPIRTAAGDELDASIVDVSGVVCFVRAEDLGLSCAVHPAEINADPRTLAWIEAVRQEAGRRIGACSPGSPRLLLVGEAREHRLGDGRLVAATTHDLVGRAMSMQRMHHACPLTVLQCAAAAALIPGSVVAETVQTRESLKLAHPKKVVEARVGLRSGSGAIPDIEHVRVELSARRLCYGRAYVSLAGPA